MSAEGTIVASHLWKRFKADRGRPVLRDELERLRGRNQRGWTWVLRDIDFRVEPGEAVGLFGTNGSGKSTLLKILTRVMYPHSGHLDVAGRVGALIEIKAGIHPDLTGRENVYLYGSLMGLSRAEVARRFDEIIDFAEIESAIDRQVKFYSSGMGMRLGFAVAAFLNPDILLVDEVLAVGDAVFQQKCLNRMRQVRESGTTIVYVSHDLKTVEAICSRGIWLDAGVIRADASVTESLSDYRNALETTAEEMTADAFGLQLRASVESATMASRYAPLTVHVTLRGDHSLPERISICIGITDGTASPIIYDRQTFAPAGNSLQTQCHFEHLPIAGGRYFVWGAAISESGVSLPWQPLCPLMIEGSDAPPTPVGVTRAAPIVVPTSWTSVVADEAAEMEPATERHSPSPSVSAHSAPVNEGADRSAVTDRSRWRR